jgi:hypothetical protein
MTETKKTKPAAGSPESKQGSLVDALFDVGLSWASYGLKVSRIALDKSAEGLEKTAKRLGELSSETAKKLGELSSELGKKSDALKVEDKKAA